MLGLSALATKYVDAINTSGAIPNIQCRWDAQEQEKCLDAKQACLQRVTSLLSEKLPCDKNELPRCDTTALDEDEKLFMMETTGISNLFKELMTTIEVKLFLRYALCCTGTIGLLQDIYEYFSIIFVNGKFVTELFRRFKRVLYCLF